MPVRLFLGAAFLVAGVTHLFGSQFFSSNSASSIQNQLGQNIPSSPISPLLRVVAHHTVGVGITIALGELAVGLGTLLGAWSRMAAVGGFVLSGSFFLATSWHTSPIYLSDDLVYLIAWTPLVMVGAGGVASLEKYWGRRPRRQ